MKAKDVSSHRPVWNYGKLNLDKCCFISALWKTSQFTARHRKLPSCWERRFLKPLKPLPSSLNLPKPHSWTDCNKASFTSQEGVWCSVFFFHAISDEVGRSSKQAFESTSNFGKGGFSQECCMTTAHQSWSELLKYKYSPNFGLEKLCSLAVICLNVCWQMPKSQPR